MSTSEIRIATPLGTLIGEVVGSDDRAVQVFKGIPYAVPPVGVRRWRAPEPIPAWEGLKSARGFSPACVQNVDPEGTFYHRPPEPQSEDCLYLNVWTPADRGSELLPVMVYIHGGGFQTGSGSVPSYDGCELARKGVLVVTINYRLGVFGYFTHPEIVKEAGPDGLKGNFGTADQIEALRWVRDNIAAFGGDPNTVTIFGESAGSLSVSQLMASPLAKGLFHRAIGQSGAYFLEMPVIGKAGVSSPPAEEMGAAFAQAIGAPSLDELRALSAEELLRLAAVAAPQHLANGGPHIVVDGLIFPESVHETFQRRAQHPVPVIAGFNADEGSGIADFGLVPVYSEDEYRAQVEARFGSMAEDFTKVYPAETPVESAFDAYRDDMFGWGMVEWVDAVSESGVPAFLYRFEHAPPGADVERLVFGGPAKRRIGAFHGAEIPFAFGNVTDGVYSLRGDPRIENQPVGGPVRASDLALSQAMSDYWVAFAKTGRPMVEGAPEWPAYSRADRGYMAFGEAPTPSKNLQPGMWELYSRINEARREAGRLGHFYALGLHSEPVG